MSKQLSHERITQYRVSEERRSQRILIETLALFAGAFIYILMFVFGTMALPAKTSGGSVNRAVLPENVADAMQAMEAEVPALPLSYEAMMSSTWVVSSADGHSENVFVENSRENAYPVYFTLSIPGEEEPLYTSEVLPVGGRINEIHLTRIPTAGTYDGTVTYVLLDEQGNSLGQVSAGVRLEIGD